MDAKMGVCCFFLWLVALTATVQGEEYKSCSELVRANKNLPPYSVSLGGKSYDVQCNMSSSPVETTIKVKNKTRDGTYYVMYYEGVPLDAMKELVAASEDCKQIVSYACENAAEFTKQNAVWFDASKQGKYAWGECEGACQCDSSGSTEARVLTKAQGIPVSQVQTSNVTIGDLVCYGDLQGAVTFNDRASYSSVNLTDNENLVSFKFKSSHINQNKTLAIITLQNGDYIEVGVDTQKNIFTSYNLQAQTYMAVDEAWHSVKVMIQGNEVKVSVDHLKKPIKEHASGTEFEPRVKLTFGAATGCRSFIGCLKDVKIGGKDVTAQLLTSPDKLHIVEGCQQVVDDVWCKPAGGTRVSTPPTGGGGHGDDGGDDTDTAVIVIVVILLLLLILLLVAFFITWYLKRNKGVYQTHEGSAEDIHGDADNLTLVTKPTEQEDEAQKSKEYYL